MGEEDGKAQIAHGVEEREQGRHCHAAGREEGSWGGARLRVDARCGILDRVPERGVKAPPGWQRDRNGKQQHHGDED